MFMSGDDFEDKTVLAEKLHAAELEATPIYGAMFDLLEGKDFWVVSSVLSAVIAGSAMAMEGRIPAAKVVNFIAECARARLECIREGEKGTNNV
jgi:hypothetical protein